MSRARLEAVYREHRQGLYTLALSIAAHPEAAEDAVHHAFEKLFGRTELPADLVPYVFAAVRNAALDERRRRPIPNRAAVFEESGPDPAQDAARGEEAVRAREALLALPDEERETIIFRLYAGLTFEQISGALGAPLPTVASRYRRGLSRIRERLKEPR